MKNLKFSILFASIVGGAIYLSPIKKNLVQYLPNIFTRNQLRSLREFILPYKIIIEQAKDYENINKEIIEHSNYLSELEILKKISNTDIKTIKTTNNLPQTKFFDLNNITLEKHRLTSGFYSGISLNFPGSGYIDFYKDDMIIVSSKGVLAYSKKFPSNEVVFKQIKHNIDEFKNLKQFKKSKTFSIKDLLIFKKSIYISYTDEISEDCWNTSVISGDIDYKKINFQKLFVSKKCIHSTKNPDNEFKIVQSGGRLIPFDNDNIVLSVGDYRNRYLAQNIDSVNGKLIKINLNNKKHEIISMGHRNPQGLYLDKENNFLLETEHGPFGGDEINLLKGIKTNEDNIYNFGWAIASAGEHYGGKIKDNQKKYEKYPLHKSHSEFGFIEPLKSFVPSIGISEIVKIGKKNYVVSSLKDKSLYFFTLNDSKLIKNLDRIFIGERIRDLKLKNKRLHMFLEDTASIGILNLN